MTSVVCFILVCLFVTVSANEQCCPLGTSITYKNETFISIRYSKINVIQNDTFQNCAGIEQLHITKSNITAIRLGTFRYITGLKELDLSDNNIQYLSDQFKQLTSLERLTIHNNNLYTFGKDLFSNMYSLQYLDMSKNCITFLPTKIFINQSKLEYLSLAFNSISTLTEGMFDNNKALLWLYLQYNRITTLPKGLFKNLDKLVVIGLGDNKISSIGENVFPDNIKQIYLRGNQLKYLDKGLFKNLDQLIIIGLGDNKISSIGENVFPDNLQQVSLHRNQLKYLDASFLKLSKLSLLLLYGNPWHCDCRLEAFFSVTKSFHEKVQCDKPNDLHQKLWTNLTSDHFQCPIEPNTTCMHDAERKKFSYKINASNIFCEDDNDGIFNTNGLRYKMKFNNSRLELEYMDMETELEPQCLEGILIAVEAILLVIVFIITYLLVKKLKQRANTISQNVTRNNTNIYTEWEVPNTTVSSSSIPDYEVENVLYGIELKANESTH